LLTGPVLDHGGKPTPVWVAQAQGGTADVFIDSSHELFTQFAWDYADALVMELAHLLKAKCDSDLTVATISARILRACFADRVVDSVRVAGQAHALLAEIRQHMADQVAEDPVRAFQWLGPDEAVTTENNMIADGARGDGSLDANSRFVLYAPPLFLVRLLEEAPEAFLDSRVFRTPYQALGSLAAKRVALSRVTSLLADVAAAANLTNSGGIVRLVRARLSVALLSDELAADV
jgi:hypothetical protein